MIQFQRCLNKATILKYKTYPKVFELIAETGITRESFKISEDDSYYLVKNEKNKTLGMYQLRTFSRRVIELHMIILPKYWGTDTSTEVFNSFIKYIKEKNIADLVITFIPEHCKAAISFAKRHGGKEYGRLPKVIINNDDKSDCIMIGTDLRGEV